MKKALIQIFTGALVFLSFLVLLLWLGKQSLSVDSFTLLLVISSLVVITSIWFNITGHWLLGAMLNLNVLALLVAINLASLIGFSSYLFTFSTIWWEAGLVFASLALIYSIDAIGRKELKSIRFWWLPAEVSIVFIASLALIYII